MQDAQLTKGERLRKLRLQLGYNQTEFGNELQRVGIPVAQNYLSKIEKGERNMGSDVQTRIEARFNIRPQWLNDGIGEMFVNGEAPSMAPLTEQRQEQIKKALSSLPSRIAQQQTPTWVSVRERSLFLRDSEHVLLRRAGLPQIAERTYGFEVADGSMMPRFPIGAYLICSLTHVSEFVKGLACVLATDEQLYIAQFEGIREENIQVGYLNDSRKDTVQVAAVRGAYHIELMLVKP
jgi:transcriptional regulator with XRE-family HTH domain